MSGDYVPQYEYHWGMFS